MPSTNCEVSLSLTWSANCVLTSKAYREVNVETAIVRMDNQKNATFKITDTKLYMPVVTSSTQNDNKLLEQ